MNQKSALETAKELLKAAQEKPEQFQDINKAAEPFHPGPSRSEHQKIYDAKLQSEREAKLKTPEGNAQRIKENKERIDRIKKDDMPHLPNSPEDKAHDVMEEDQSLQQALSLLDTPEKRKKMLEHLQSLGDESQQRSEENQEAGETPQEEAKEKLMEKSEMVKAAKQLIELAKNEPSKFEEIVKAMSTPAPAPMPAAKKPAAAAPKMPAMQMKKPAMAKCGTMSKEEIKSDLKQEWKPKFLKAKGK